MRTVAVVILGAAMGVFRIAPSFGQSFYSQVSIQGNNNPDGTPCQVVRTAAVATKASLTCSGSTGDVAATASASASLASGTAGAKYNGNYHSDFDGDHYNAELTTTSLADVITIVGPLPKPKQIVLRLLVNGSISGSPNPDQFVYSSVNAGGEYSVVYWYGYDGVSSDPVSYLAQGSATAAETITSANAARIQYKLIVRPTVSDSSRDISFNLQITGEASPCIDNGNGCIGSATTQVTFPRARLQLVLPPGLSFTSASGVLLTEP